MVNGEWWMACTVGEACRRQCEAEVWMVNVYFLSGTGVRSSELLPSDRYIH